MSNTTSATFSGNDVVVLNQIEYILKRPQNEIGSLLPDPKNVIIYKDNLFSMTTTDVPFGLERIYLEIFYNAIDNLIKSRAQNIPTSYNHIDIIVEIQDNKISITNYGIGIPIELHKSGDYVPTVIFSKLNSSSNYKGNNIGSGSNGHGAKACNIFSKLFEVEICNNSKIFKQTWKNNLSQSSEPSIIALKKDKHHYTKVSFIPDYERFTYQMNNDFINVIKTHCALSSYACQCNIKFVCNNNSETFKIKDISKHLFADAKKIKIDMNIENSTCYIIDTPENQDPINISFINGLYLPNNGEHIEILYKTIIDKIKNSDFMSKSISTNDMRFTKNDVKSISVVINLNLDNNLIEYDGHMKKKINKFKTKLEYNIKDISKLKTWNIAKVIDEKIKSKIKNKRKEKDGKNTRHIDIMKLTDANKVCKQNSKCSLFVCEGDSAKGYIDIAISFLKGGRDYYGVLPLRGKLLNFKTCKPEDVEKSKEWYEIKNALGICEDVDYTIEKNRKKLRYGKLIIAADADDDGKHIIGLVMNFFHTLYPSLIYANFIYVLRTPIIRIKDRKGVWTSFYERSEFDRFMEGKNPSQYTIDYFKGLGSSPPEFIEQDMKNPKIELVVPDQYIDFSLDMAFSEHQKALRRAWVLDSLRRERQTQLDMISEDSPINKVFELEEKNDCVSVTSFVSNELIEYEKTSVSRAIPAMIDGFKDSQRKIMWYGLTSVKDKFINVDDFSTSAKKKTAYHHGCTSLQKAITLMAQRYVGTNNIPYFKRYGVFGTRTHNGNDASSARYIKCCLEDYMKYVFRSEDMKILEKYRRYEEDVLIEPSQLLPVIPLILINGRKGVSSGYSMMIPQFNPDDVINWLLERLDIDMDDEGEKEVKQVIRPYYWGYYGSLEIDEIKGIIKTKGVAQYTERESGVYDVDISELPIKMATADFEAELKKMALGNDIEDYSINNIKEQDDLFRVSIKIKGLKKKERIEQMLESSISLNNIYLLDKFGIPKHYKNHYEVIEDFYNVRLEYYEERRQETIKDLEQELNGVLMRLKIVEAKISGSLVIEDKEEADIKRQCKKLGIEYDIVDNMKMRDLKREQIKVLNGRKNELEKELKKLRNTKGQDLWYKDLIELKKACEGVYKY